MTIKTHQLKSELLFPSDGKGNRNIFKSAPSYSSPARGVNKSFRFVVPWQAPLGDTTKHKTFSSRDFQKPPICNHYF